MQYRDFSLLALANPGASEGDVIRPKSEIFASMTPEARQWVAPFVLVGRRGRRAAAPTSLELRMLLCGPGLPAVAKPDRGAGRKGVRVIADEDELHDYILAFPPEEDFLLQKLIDFPYEAGIMYERRPGRAQGTIISLALKEAPAVTGDGSSTLRDLIEAHPNARQLGRDALARHGGRLNAVPAPGERIELAFARNRCGGAVCLDGRELITPELNRRIDQIARGIPSFHIGRFDVRFESAERLRSGEGFRILEVNCGASEPLHAWAPENSVFETWRAYFEQVDRLFAIAAENRARGHRSSGTVAFVRSLLRHARQRRAYPAKS